MEPYNRRMADVVVMASLMYELTRAIEQLFEDLDGQEKTPVLVRVRPRSIRHWKLTLTLESAMPIAKGEDLFLLFTSRRLGVMRANGIITPYEISTYVHSVTYGRSREEPFESVEDLKREIERFHHRTA